MMKGRTGRDSTRTGAILITGCSSGIGRSAALGLAQRGRAVITACRTEVQCDELRAMGLKAVAIDNESKESIQRGWDEALALAGGGGIRGVFANAGYGMPGALEDITWEALDKQLRTNVLGTHALVRLAIAHMRQRGEGRIVICSSVLGLVGLRMRGAYVASKFALEGMADVLRLELKDSGVDVALLEPGPVLTRFRANSYTNFKQFVDAENSVHRQAYARLAERLQANGPVAPFTAAADGCLGMLEHALDAPRPRARYRWTPQTVVFAFLKRLLPSRWLDAVAARG